MALQSYKGLRVLVTGHTGFKGSWLSHWLLDLGAKVAGFALPPHTCPSMFKILGLSSRLRHTEGDVRNLDAVKRAFSEFRPELVIHFAAQAIIRTGYDEPKSTFDTNLGGTVNVLEATRAQPSIRALVVCTSDKCYENVEWLWGYRENDRLGGKDPYSASKACAELAVRSYLPYFTKRGLGLATVRAGNVIGGGDWSRDRVLPDCVNAWAKGRAVLIRHPLATRPWQHVLDPLGGYLALGEALLQGRPGFTGEAFNFGPSGGVERSVADLVNAMLKTWPAGRWRPSHPGRYPPEATLLKLNSEKALRLLGWSGTLDFAEAVRLTAEWYRAQRLGRRDMRDLTSEEIALYLRLAAERGKGWLGSGAPPASRKRL